jgi:hypothetical protein
MIILSSIHSLAFLTKTAAIPTVEKLILTSSFQILVGLHFLFVNSKQIRNNDW